VRAEKRLSPVRRFVLLSATTSASNRRIGAKSLAAFFHNFVGHPLIPRDVHQQRALVFHLVRCVVDDPDTNVPVVRVFSLDKRNDARLFVLMQIKSLTLLQILECWYRQYFVPAMGW
jgi:hypothetical protein